VSIESKTLLQVNIPRYALILILISLTLFTCFYFDYAYKVLSFPYTVDSGEGLSFNRALILSKAGNIYTPINNEPYTVTNYPPFFEILLAGIIKLFGPKLLWGRLISFCAGIIDNLWGLLQHFVL